MRYRLYIRCLLLLAIPIVSGQTPPAFTSQTPANILDQFHNASQLWLVNIMSTAQYLFWALALLDFIVMASSLLVEGADFHGWAAGLTRKILFIGFWWTLLVNAQDWLPGIISSFTTLGQRASGTSAVHPTDVFTTGLQLAGALVDGGVGLGALMEPSTAMFSILAAVIVAISYAFISVTFLMTVIEGYVAMSVGYIFLGLAGSRWTNDYAMRYVSLVVGVGVKLLLLYCLIGAGSQLSTTWSNELAAASGVNVLIALDVCAGSLMFALLCWHVPRLFSTLMSGSPTLGHGEAMAAIAGISVAASRLTTAVSSMGGSAAIAGGSSASFAGSGASMASSGAGGGTYSNGGSSASGGSGGGSSISSHVASVKAANTSVSPPVTPKGGK